MASQQEQDDKIRLDKWLWAARFFKTRSLATDAINGGHVLVNGARVKPSREVHVDDELKIRHGNDDMVVIVRDLSARRGPASVAQLLYAETEASQKARQERQEQRRMAPPVQYELGGRPTKKNRRRIHRFTDNLE